MQTWFGNIVIYPLPSHTRMFFMYIIRWTSMKTNVWELSSTTCVWPVFRGPRDQTQLLSMWTWEHSDMTGRASIWTADIQLTFKTVSFWWAVRVFCKKSLFFNRCYCVWCRVRLVEKGSPHSLPLMESGKVRNQICTPVVWCLKVLKKSYFACICIYERTN